MNNTETLSTINTTVAKYDMTAQMSGDLIEVYDKKGRLAGTVASYGVIDRKFYVKMVRMGALVRDAITTALEEK